MGDVRQDPFAIASNPTIKGDHFDVEGYEKKRKYEDEHFGHPVRKHQFRVRPHGCGFECQIHAKERDGEVNRESSFGLDYTESVKDSNSFMGIYDDNSLALDAESTGQTYVRLYKPYSVEAASSSGNSSDSVNDNYKSNLNSQESRSANNKNGKRPMESVPIILDDGIRCKSSSSQDPFAAFEMSYASSAFEMSYASYADFLCGEYGIDSEQVSEFPTEELLYSNDVAPNMLLLPSGGWSPAQEAQGKTRTPTIDQEFEQYFSSLML